MSLFTLDFLQIFVGGHWYQRNIQKINLKIAPQWISWIWIEMCTDEDLEILCFCSDKKGFRYYVGRFAKC